MSDYEKCSVCGKKYLPIHAGTRCYDCRMNEKIYGKMEKEEWGIYRTYYKKYVGEDGRLNDSDPRIWKTLKEATEFIELSGWTDSTDGTKPNSAYVVEFISEM